MKRLLLWIVMAMCLTYGATGFLVEYSEDNLTWTNVTYINETSGIGYQLFLEPCTTYYFRASNDSVNWNYTSTKTSMDGECSMSTWAITFFVLASTAVVFLLPFFVRFHKTELTNFIIKRCCWVLALYLMALNTGIMLHVAEAAELAITNELVLYLSIFGWGGYIAAIVMGMSTLFGAFKLMRENVQQKRYGDFEE